MTTEVASHQGDVRFTTLGVDLASQPQNTAVCVINWGQESAQVSGLTSGLFGSRVQHVRFRQAVDAVGGLAS